MRKYQFMILMLMLGSGILVAQNEDFRKTAPEPGPAPLIQIGDFVDFELDNGLHVIVVENHKLPRVSFQLFVDVPLHSEGNYAGTAEMAGGLLRTGTATKEKAEIDEAIDFVGANLNTSSTGAFGSALSQHKEHLMGIMADVILNPTFPEEEFDKLKRQTISGLAQAKEDPGQIASNVAQVLRYGKDYPYGEIMTESTVENITAEKCKEYYTTYFKPNMSYLVMVGDITAKEARTLAMEHFGTWEKEILLKDYIAKPSAPEETQVDFVAKAGAVQSIINITYPIRLKPGTLDVIKTQALNTILGSSFNGRLFANLREDKAYTYGAYSSINSDPNVGYFNASASVRNEVTDSAVHEFLYELDRIRTEMVSEEELDRAKNMITGSFARSMESPEAVASFALNTIRYKLPRDFYATYLKNLARVTPADILEIAQEYIKPANAHILVVGNKDEAESLTRFAANGKINHYDAFGTLQEEVKMPLPAGLTAEKVIDTYLTAIGGKDRLNNVTDLTTEMSAAVQGMAMTMTMKRKEPQMLSMTVGASGMTMQEVVLNGDQLKMSQMGQPMESDDEAVASFQSQSIIFPEADYAGLGFTVELDGQEKVGTEAVYVVKVTSPNGEQSMDYYSVESGLKVRSVTSQDETTITTDLSDYQEVDGILFPFQVTSSGMMPMPLELKVESVKVNAGIEDSTFSVD